MSAATELCPLVECTANTVSQTLCRVCPNAPTVHPDDLAEHLAYEHRLGDNVLQPGMPRDVLEMAHMQRHDGYGVGADHPRDHAHRTGGFT